MHIVFLTRSLNFGGAERQLVALGRGLHNAGHEVCVATFYGGGPLEQDLRQAGIRVQALNKRGRWDVLRFLGRLLRFVRSERPDILHSYLVVPNLVTVLLRPLLPKIRIVWGVRASDMDLSYYDWSARFTFSLSCRLSNLADLIIANSRSGMVFHRDKGYPAHKMVVIPNGIDTDRFRPTPEAREKTRAEWGIGVNETVIGIVGRLDPMKDYPNFLRAASLMSHARSGVRFVCVGDGPKDYRDRLERLAGELGLDNRVVWAGTRSDLPAVYSAFDLATSASSSEGFPNVVAEAMACGLPCVVTDAGDSASIVGTLGIVVPPADPERLARAWDTALSQIGPAKAAQTRKRVIDEFSLASLISRSEQVLQQLISGPKC